MLNFFQKDKIVTCDVYGGGTREVPAYQLLFRPSAYGLIVKDGRLLLLRMPGGRYFLPGGGVEPGEGLAEAVEREVLEETRCVCQAVGRPFWTAERFFCVNEMAWHVLAYFFACQVVSVPAVVNPSALLEPEIEGLPEWVALESAAQMPMVSLSREAIGAFLRLKAGQEMRVLACPDR